MTYLLIPGRHLLTTQFQEEYLSCVLSKPIRELDTLGEWEGNEEKFTQVIFAITSANQAYSRYNPVPFHIRSILVDRFSQWLYKKTNIPSRLVGIPHYKSSKNFAENVLKHIEERTEGDIILNPENTIVLSSTPSVVRMYQSLGYVILPAEYDFEKDMYVEITPSDVVKNVAELDGKWLSNSSEKVGLSHTTSLVWEDYPEVPKIIKRIWRDPLLTEEGSLTETRNYSTYSDGMNHKALMDLKYGDIKHFIVPGKIVDEGCADGALLIPISIDHPDSDLIGIEITGEFTARFKERQRAGDFGGSFSHVHQRNLMDDIFEPNSIDTTICNSTTHELWSYGEQEKTLIPYLERKYKQLQKGGRLIIRDVVGPTNNSDEVYMWLDDEDGSNEDVLKTFDTPLELKKHLDGLSTSARFKRFAEDFLQDMRSQGKRDESSKITYKEVDVQGKQYFVTTLKHAAEFLSKKDYTDNWQSELNEEFTHWSFDTWKKTLREIGFSIIQNVDVTEKSSRSYANEWIIENRYKGKATLHRMEGEVLMETGYPVTNMVLVGEKK